MQFIKISLIAAAVLSGFALAGKEDLDDIPSACRVACAPIKQIARTCSFKNFGDRRELACICSAQDAQQHAISCESCILPQHRDVDEHDITQVNKACNWKQQPVTTSTVPPFTSWPRATGLVPLPGRRTA